MSRWKAYICEQSGGPAGLQEFLEPQQRLNREEKSPGQQDDQFLRNLFPKCLCMTLISQRVSPGLVVTASFKTPISKALFQMINQGPSTEGGVHLPASSGQGCTDTRHVPEVFACHGALKRMASNQPRLYSGKSRFSA